MYKGVGPIGSKSHGTMLDKKYLCATVQDREQDSGLLAPEFVEWLMSFPRNYTNTKEDYVPKNVSERVGGDWSSEWQDCERLTNNRTDRTNRLKCLGNAVVPKVAEIIGQRILEIDGLTR